MTSIISYASSAEMRRALQANRHPLAPLGLNRQRIWPMRHCPSRHLRQPQRARQTAAAIAACHNLEVQTDGCH